MSTNANPAAPSFRVLGITDNVNQCDCCGRSELQKTVVIENTETGEIKYFGTTCALQPVKGFGITRKDIAKAEKDFEFRKVRLGWETSRIYKERGGEWDIVTGRKGNGKEVVLSRTPKDAALWKTCQREALAAL